MHCTFVLICLQSKDAYPTANLVGCVVCRRVCRQVSLTQKRIVAQTKADSDAIERLKIKNVWARTVSTAYAVGLH
jgi:hypothetical protein